MKRNSTKTQQTQQSKDRNLERAFCVTDGIALVGMLIVGLAALFTWYPCCC